MSDGSHFLSIIQILISFYCPLLYGKSFSIVILSTVSLKKKNRLCPNKLSNLYFFLRRTFEQEAFQIQINRFRKVKSIIKTETTSLSRKMHSCLRWIEILKNVLLYMTIWLLFSDCRLFSNATHGVST